MTVYLTRKYSVAVNDSSLDYKECLTPYPAAIQAQYAPVIDLIRDAHANSSIWFRQLRILDYWRRLYRNSVNNVLVMCVTICCLVLLKGKASWVYLKFVTELRKFSKKTWVIIPNSKLRISGTIIVKACLPMDCRQVHVTGDWQGNADRPKHVAHYAIHITQYCCDSQLVYSFVKYMF
jgi:hypothetical protein